VRLRLSTQFKTIVSSISIGFVVWLLAKSGDTVEGRLIVPVRVDPGDPRIEASVSPTYMPVYLRYPRDMEPYISSENFSLVVDAPELRAPGKLKAEWTEVSKSLSPRDFVANVPQPRRIIVTKIGQKDSTVGIRMRWKTVQAQIRPQIVGADRIPAGYQLIQPVRVNPREVYLVGDQAALDSLPRDPETSRVVVSTEPISVADRTQNALEAAGLILPPGVEMIERPSNLVEVALEIQQVHTVRDIKGVPVDFSPVNPENISVSYTPRTITVKVSGPQALLRDLTPQSFAITFVRPPEELPGTTREVALQVRFADSVSPEARQRLSIRGIDPPVITVRFSEK
jgi:hypothetical protein